MPGVVKINFMNLELLTPEELLAQAKSYAAEIETLQLASVEKEKECAEHMAAMQEQAEQIELLNGIIGNAKTNQTIIDTNAKKDAAPVIPADPIEHKDKKYQWQRAAFRFPGDIKKITAQEASVDPEVLDRLLAIPGQSILKELE